MEGGCAEGYGHCPSDCRLVRQPSWHCCPSRHDGPRWWGVEVEIGHVRREYTATGSSTVIASLSKLLRSSSVTWGGDRGWSRSGPVFFDGWMILMGDVSVSWIGVAAAPGTMKSSSPLLTTDSNSLSVDTGESATSGGSSDWNGAGSGQCCGSCSGSWRSSCRGTGGAGEVELLLRLKLEEEGMETGWAAAGPAAVVGRHLGRRFE